MGPHPPVPSVNAQELLQLMFALAQHSNTQRGYPSALLYKGAARRHVQPPIVWVFVHFGICWMRLDVFIWEQISQLQNPQRTIPRTAESQATVTAHHPTGCNSNTCVNISLKGNVHQCSSLYVFWKEGMHLSHFFLTVLSTENCKVRRN